MMVCVVDYFVTCLIDVLVSKVQIDPKMKVNCLKVQRGGTIRPSGVVEPEHTHR